MASNLKKPMGITILRKRDVPRNALAAASGDMHGVGQKTADKLKTIGIHTIEDLAKANEYTLKRITRHQWTEIKAKGEW